MLGEPAKKSLRPREAGLQARLPLLSSASRLPCVGVGAAQEGERALSQDAGSGSAREPCLPPLLLAALAELPRRDALRAAGEGQGRPDLGHCAILDAEVTRREVRSIHCIVQGLLRRSDEET